MSQHSPARNVAPVGVLSCDCVARSISNTPKLDAELPIFVVHAQVWNGSELARAFGVSHHTVRRYLDVLEATFMIRSLKPWSANLGKRQVRSPKVYARDSGLPHRLLGIDSREQLERHPKVGASWEGFVVENAIRALGAENRQHPEHRDPTVVVLDMEGNMPSD